MAYDQEEERIRKMNVKITGTLSCECRQPPFIFFTPDGDHLIAIEADTVLVWNIESKTVVHRHVSTADMSFCHGSIRQMEDIHVSRSRPFILENTSNFGHDFFIDDDLDTVGSHPTISTFSPDGETLVTARNDSLSHVDVEYGWAATDRYYVATTRNRETRENRIKDLRFMKDGSKLTLTCETKVVIMDTRTSRWFRSQAIEYPCRASGINISPGDMRIACGSTTGDLWLWISDMSCWDRRSSPPSGRGATSEPVDNVRFSASGRSILYNHRGDSEVSLCQTESLDRICVLTDLRDAPGQRIGNSLLDPRRCSGATAHGGQRGTRVIFWEYEA